jgi:predicted amidohydrolase
MQTEFKVGAIQFGTFPGDRDKNLSTAVKLLEKAGQSGVRLAVFPEYCWTGYPHAKFAETIPEGTIIKDLAGVARKLEMYIVTGSFVEKDGPNLFSSNVLIGPDGNVVGKQRKVHLLDSNLGGPIKDELGVGLKPGSSFEVFKTELGNIGILTGSDMDPPETARTLALKGADILAVSLAGDIKWLDCIRYMPRTRAYENGVYVIVSNRFGKWERSPIGDITYGGSSMVISALGEILGSAGEYSEGVAVTTISVSRLHEMRKGFNILALRKTKTYSLE